MRFGFVRYALSDLELHQQRAELAPFLDTSPVIMNGALPPYRSNRLLHDLVAKMSDGDSLIVTSTDRVVQSLQELALLLEDLRQQGASLMIVEGRKLKPCLSIETLSPLVRAEIAIRNERRVIGIRKAAERGDLGRKPTFDYREAQSLFRKGATVKELAAKYQVSARTIQRALANQNSRAKVNSK